MSVGKRLAAVWLGVELVLATTSVGLADLTGFSLAGDRATARIEAGTFRIVEVPEGHRIEMDGFDRLMTPGQPLLPVKRILVALPPGARARSVEVLRAETSRLEGNYRIESCPATLPLADDRGFERQWETMQREWEVRHETAYRSDAPVPERVAWLAGSGTLRKYSYASVAFCPFTYEPRSGRLAHHASVEIAIRYDLPAPGSAEARHTEQLLQDDLADGRARRLFPNYDAIAGLYEDPQAKLQERYDYVIITTAGLAGAVTSSILPAYRSSLGHRLRTVLTTDPEITSQPGTDLAGQIRSFLRSRYATWGIEHVLLVGDYATVPMRICYPDPAFHVYNPDNPGLVAPGTPTDYYYADLSFPDEWSWDSDHDGFPGEYLDDSPDFLAEVAVGRIPTSDPVRIQYTLDKLVAFDQDTGPWKNNALLAAAILFFENQDHGGAPFVDGATCLDSLATALMGGWTVSRYSERAGLVTSSFPWTALSQAAFGAAWRSGEYAVVNWSGHGWCDRAARTVWEWDDGDGVPESSNGELVSRSFVAAGSSALEDDRPSIVFAVSCNVGYPEPNSYGNLGIDLLTRPGWGSSAGIVCSSRPAAVSGDWMTNPGGTESICYEFNRYLLAQAEPVGDALYDGKFYANVHYGWDHVYEYMNLYNFNLYGDPALVVNRATATAAPPAVARGAPLLLEPARPNPFASTTDLRFTLPHASRVRITIHDINGREIAVLADRAYEAGLHTVAWNGSADTGRPVASGMYFCRMQA